MVAKVSKLRERILAAVDILFEDVEIKQWTNEDGTPVVIRCKTMSARQRAAWIDSASDSTGKLRAMAMYDIVLTNCFDPENGELVFDIADRDALLDKSGAAMGKLQECIFRLSGLSGEAAAEATKN